MNKHINKISNYAMVGGLSAVAVVGFAGCGEGGTVQQQPQQPPQEQSVVKEGASVTIEKQADGSYKILDEFPSVKTRIILIEDGAERILSQEEIDKLVKEEEARVEAGTSNLTKSPEEQASAGGGGLGLAGTLMASMAAGMVGAMLMNKLMNNQNYKQNQRASHKSASSYSRSQKAQANNNAARKSASSSKKSGFFGNNKKASSSSSSRSSSFGG